VLQSGGCLVCLLFASLVLLFIFFWLVGLVSSSPSSSSSSACSPFRSADVQVTGASQDGEPVPYAATKEFKVTSFTIGGDQ
jgi:hypothetical protein